MVEASPTPTPKEPVTETTYPDIQAAEETTPEVVNKPVKKMKTKMSKEKAKKQADN